MRIFYEIAHPSFIFSSDSPPNNKPNDNGPTIV